MKSLFFNYDEYKLEKFQFENLSTSIVNFTFISMDPVGDVPIKFKQVFLSVQVLETPFESLWEQNFNKENPVILICKKGRKSRKAVKKGVGSGFKNIYFVEGGLEALS